MSKMRLFWPAIFFFLFAFSSLGRVAHGMMMDGGMRSGIELNAENCTACKISETCTFRKATEINFSDITPLGHATALPAARRSFFDYAETLQERRTLPLGDRRIHKPVFLTERQLK